MAIPLHPDPIFYGTHQLLYGKIRQRCIWSRPSTTPAWCQVAKPSPDKAQQVDRHLRPAGGQSQPAQPSPSSRFACPLAASRTHTETTRAITARAAGDQHGTRVDWLCGRGLPPRRTPPARGGLHRRVQTSMQRAQGGVCRDPVSHHLRSCGRRRVPTRRSGPLGMENRLHQALDLTSTWSSPARASTSRHKKLANTDMKSASG
jgi:hypothetical protein